MFIDRKKYLKIFYAVDEKLQEIEELTTNKVCKIFNIDREDAKYVVKEYPNLSAVHRVIYSYYRNNKVIWENKKGEKFILTYSSWNTDYSKNRWNEFKYNMLIDTKNGE